MDAEGIDPVAELILTLSYPKGRERSIHLAKPTILNTGKLKEYTIPHWN